MTSCKSWQKFMGVSGFRAWCSCSALLKPLAGQCSLTSCLPAVETFLETVTSVSHPQPTAVHVLRCSYLLCAVVWRCVRLLPIDDAQKYTAWSYKPWSYCCCPDMSSRYASTHCLVSLCVGGLMMGQDTGCFSHSYLQRQ